MSAKTLMVVGSMSSSGKSLLVAALCRIYARRGYKVAPFKAQNMSNNAAVCADGSEIGRAQALQALAAGIEPEVCMNPVLIKPEADSYSQVILMGKPWSHLHASNFYQKKAQLWKAIPPALEELRNRHDLVIIEGAGSPVELNLKQGDIVNMAVAKLANAPTLLVGDIDRGGIFAQLLGTLWLLEEDERSLIKGLVINKFRGDRSLFNDGIKLMEEKAGVPVLGVLPWLKDLGLPEEDAASLDTYRHDKSFLDRQNLDIAVIKLPRIANFDDFDPLRAESGLQLRFLEDIDKFAYPDAVILPGTKSTRADLQWLEQTGLAAKLRDYAAKGGCVVGICGGYQMLGESIEDPHQVESNAPAVSGLGLLPLRTVFSEQKSACQTQAQVCHGQQWLAGMEGQSLFGYEIHNGQTSSSSPWLKYFREKSPATPVFDGAISPDAKIWGCYLHGLFANQNLRHAWLKSLDWKATPRESLKNPLEKSLDTLADAVEQNLDIELLDKIIWG
ncbi:MAG: cobyric acid synthase [Anaerolineaceae bacterium]|nr:cobyric acid synthase [Anaerolineaceae bacterium]